MDWAFFIHTVDPAHWVAVWEYVVLRSGPQQPMVAWEIFACNIIHARGAMKKTTSTKVAPEKHPAISHIVHASIIGSIKMFQKRVLQFSNLPRASYEGLNPIVVRSLWAVKALVNTHVVPNRFGGIFNPTVKLCIGWLKRYTNIQAA